MLLRREASEERDEHIDMTPMVDVVFQLMTFMLFSVQMTGGEKVDVPPARHGVGVQESTATLPDPPEARGPRRGATAPAGPRRRSQRSPWTRPARPSPTGSAKADARSSSRPMATSRTARCSRWPSAVTEVEGVTVHVGVQEPQGAR